MIASPKFLHFILFFIISVFGTTQLYAGSYQNFNSHYAWINNWNDPNHLIQGKFGRQAAPELEVNFNISEKGLYGYPAILRGSHYGWNPTGDKLFPAQVSSLKQIPLKFSYTTRGNNMAGNFAYDIFLRNDANGGHPQLEIMIWGDHNSWPLGEKTASNVLTENGYTFDLWEGYNAAAGYYVYTFVPANTVGKNLRLPKKGNLNLNAKPFLSWLNMARGKDNHFNDSMYIDVIEAGFEVVGGQGTLKMKATLDAQKYL